MKLEKITNREELSNQLKKERLRLDISKDVFIKESKLSAITFYRIERGDFNYTVENFLMYLNTLHVFKHIK